MSLSELFRSFSRTFVHQKARVLLTLLGIVIGAGSVVMLAGILRSTKEAMVAHNQGVREMDTLRFYAATPPRHQREQTTRPLSRRDGEEVSRLAALDGVEVTAESQKIAFAHFGAKRKRVRLIGVSPSALEMYKLAVEKGRFVDEEDLRSGRRVAVLGHEVYTELFGDSDRTLGAQLEAAGETWTVVGILEHKVYNGYGNGTWMWDRRIVVPRTSFDASYSPAHKVQSLFIKLPLAFSTPRQMETAAQLSQALILRLHLGVKNFKLDRREGEKQEQSIMDIVQILLVATVMMSMFVGGINIMNIMLVTVTERTREIGIRRALGADRWSIIVQFLFESAAISSIGGLIGIVGGVTFNWLLGLVLGPLFGNWTFYLEFWAIAMSMALAVLTGIVFGLFPAIRASRLNPVDALRADS